MSVTLIGCGCGMESLTVEAAVAVTLYDLIIAEGGY